jgi:hypothetical protein
VFSFFDAGYADGYAHGRIHGLIEGRALGREQGFALWEELGFYEAFAATWTALAPADEYVRPFEYTTLSAEDVCGPGVRPTTRVSFVLWSRSSLAQTHPRTMPAWTSLVSFVRSDRGIKDCARR